MTNDLIESLEQLLDREKAALEHGDLDKVSGETPEKEKLIGALAEMKVIETDDLIRVQRKLERNQSLLNSAAEGIRAVSDRLAELRRVRQEFSTYDASGQRSGYTVRTQAKLEKRA